MEEEAGRADAGGKGRKEKAEQRSSTDILFVRRQAPSQYIQN